jgi:predicted helicase
VTKKNSNIEIFAEYLKRLRKIATAEKTEHTDRTAIELLLEEFAKSAGRGVKVQHEPKRIADKGAPDFKVGKSGMILGYVETKALGENLTKVRKSDQITRYRSLSGNILLTDYVEWIWLKGDAVQSESLCAESDLENPKFRLRDDRVEAVSRLIEGFFSTTPEGIGRAETLALALATRAHLLREYLGVELVRQEREHREGRLFGLFEVFKTQVFHELTLAEFADAFAQMLAYGLFLARLNADANTTITLANVRQHVPSSFRLIRELVSFLDELNNEEYAAIRWVAEEVLSIVNGLDLTAIHEDLSFRQRKAVSRAVRAKDEEEWRLFSRDPFVYFYEDFLAKYDAKMKKSRGVYYTPPPIVNFIVRAVDDILKDKFEITDGLADHKRVTVLDFACGTGTFLLEAFQRIFDNIGGPQSGRANLIVRDHILKNLFGFEYLIAPYTIAHLKLSQYLSDKGHPLKEKERLRVYLTNTLEPIHPEPNFLLPAVTEESEAAQAVKDRQILAIVGNPPYAGHSKNKGQWISAAIDGYKIVNGKPLNEKNPKWLQDDYVKFIRFAQLKMDAVDQGVVGIITNHSYLDNPTFRGMRQSLMHTFNQVWILDLHGSTKPRERTPPNTPNENVFDIQKGVCIAIFIKKPEEESGIWFSELWGTRQQKYEAAAAASIHSISWEKVAFSDPYYMFRPLDWTGWEPYREGRQIADSLSPNDEKVQMFELSTLGFQTHRDDFAISFTKSEMEEKLKRFANSKVSDDQITQQYGIKSNRDWSLRESRAVALKGPMPVPQMVAYRPFDIRWSEFSTLTMDYPRRELQDHVAGKNNLCLLVSRQIGTADWRHVAIAEYPAESCYISDGSTEQNYCFPFYRYIASTGSKIENLSTSFRNFLDDRYGYHYSTEEVIGYCYAVLHAPLFRSRYAEFLRIDFPRIPFAESVDNFEKLSKLGWALVQSHLLKEFPRIKLAQFQDNGDYVVDTVRYSEVEQAVWINKEQSFRPVPDEVWGFHIGGYQVIEKYLKSRKGRALTLDEIDHVAAVADSLAFTIKLMERIDEAYRTAFPDGG